ncbi:MAG: hypothetical protein ACK52H_09810 [Burkholderiales bacterium]|jgi:hypothetical protein
MQIKPIESSSLYCVFADEMRPEADGRDNILGWYQDGSKIVMPPEGPLVMDRLLVVAIMMLPLEVKLFDLNFSLRLEGECLHQNAVPQKFFEDASTGAEKASVHLRARMFRLAVQSSQLVINSPGRLYGRISMGDLLLDSNSLEFVRQGE